MAVHKIFSVSDTNVIQDIRNNPGLHDTELLCKETAEVPENDSCALTHAVLNSLTMRFY